MATLFKAESHIISEEQTNAGKRGRQFIAASMKVDQVTASVPSAESEGSPTDISDEKKTSSQALLMSKLSSGSDCYKCEPPRNQPRTKSRLDNKNTKTTIVSCNEVPSEVPGLVAIQPVNKLLADAVKYRNYRLIRRSARYDKNLANELNKMTKKIALQMRD